MNLASLALTAVLAAHGATPAPPPAAPTRPAWLGEELPLQLAVKTPEDLGFKAVAERQYLVFNLLASGKWAWDQGDYATAAAKWEALLRLPELPANVASTVQPFAVEARKRAGGQAPGPVAAAKPVATEPTQSRHEEPSEPAVATVRGVVTGGGATGPGGSVVWLERVGGPTPRPRPAKNKVILQRQKTFFPHVLAVPVGTTVDFKNEDDIFHDVFSLSKPADFDLGLYKGGVSRSQTFENPGAVQLLCNIHTTMQGWVYVVKSPWFTQADANGAFAIKGVPPGEYTVHAWNEASARPIEERVKVEAGGATVALNVTGDAPKQNFVPDKYGKPRQVQLGY